MGAPLKLPSRPARAVFVLQCNIKRCIMTTQFGPIAERVASFLGNTALLIALPFGALAFIAQSL